MEEIRCKFFRVQARPPYKRVFVAPTNSQNTKTSKLLKILNEVFNPSAKRNVRKIDYIRNFDKMCKILACNDCRTILSMNLSKIFAFKTRLCVVSRYSQSTQL